MALIGIVVISALFFILFLVFYHCCIRKLSPHSDDGVLFDRSHLSTIRATNVDLQTIVRNEYEDQTDAQTEAVNRYNLIMAGVIKKEVIPAKKKENSTSKSSVLFTSVKFFKMKSKKSSLKPKESFQEEDTIYESERKQNNTVLKDDIQVAEYDSITRSFRNSVKSGISSSISSFRSKLSTASNLTKSTKSMYKVDTCFICLEKFKVGESIFWSKNIKCDHCFHAQCVKRWLFENDDCPLCRENFIGQTSS